MYNVLLIPGDYNKNNFENVSEVFYIQIKLR